MNLIIYLDLVSNLRMSSDISYVYSDVCLNIRPCFSTFVRPRPGKFFFSLERGPGPNRFTRQYLSIFFKFIH